MPQCSAKSKQSQQQCRRMASPGRATCKIHGGASLAGVASPAFRHGRWSKCLPSRLATRYEELLNDRDLFSVRAEIALLDLRIDAILSGDDAPTSTWLAARAKHRDLERAQREGDQEAAAVAFRALVRLVERGAGESASWAEVRQLVQERRALCEAERRHMADDQAFIPVERVMVFVAALAAAVREHVPDQHARSAILDGMRRLVEDSGAPVDARAVVAPAGIPGLSSGSADRA